MQNKEDFLLTQKKLVLLAKDMFRDGEICFSSIFHENEEDRKEWNPIEHVKGNYLSTYYEENPDWVIEISKKIADDFQKLVVEYRKRGIGDINCVSVFEEGKKRTFENLEKWSTPVIEAGLLEKSTVDEIRKEFEDIIGKKSSEGEDFFGYTHGNIIGDHVYIDKDKKIYLLNMRIVSNPGKGYYDFLRSLDWLILKADRDEEKLEKIISWMKQNLLGYDWEEVRLVFALRCLGILGWDMLHRGDLGAGDAEIKKKILLHFIKREYE